MGRKLKFGSGYCFWCARHFESLTEEHVPPKVVFPKRVRNELPSVWACEECNNGWTIDAEYFRDFLLTGALATCDHPGLVEVRAASLRATRRRQSLGMAPSVFGSTPFSLVAYGDGAGMGLPEKTRFAEVELDRISGVVCRTATGLRLRDQAAIAFKTGQPASLIQRLVPDGYGITAFDLPINHVPRALSIIAEHGSENAWAQGMLKFAAYKANDSAELEMLISFYDTAVFVARVYKLGEVRLRSFQFDFYVNVGAVERPKRKQFVPEPASLRDAIEAALYHRK